MGLIRPELAQWLAPRREFFAALAGVAFGAWVATRGGWFFGGLGLILIALGGTVPFMSFVAEHYATKDVRARMAAIQQHAEN